MRIPLPPVLSQVGQRRRGCNLKRCTGTFPSPRSDQFQSRFLIFLSEVVEEINKIFQKCGEKLQQEIRFEHILKINRNLSVLFASCVETKQFVSTKECESLLTMEMLCFSGDTRKGGRAGSDDDDVQVVNVTFERPAPRLIAPKLTPQEMLMQALRSVSFSP